MGARKQFDPAAGNDGDIVGGGAAVVQPEKTAEEAAAIGRQIVKTADASFARRHSGHLIRIRCLDHRGEPLTNGSIGTSFGEFPIGADGVASVPGEAWENNEFADAHRFQVLG